MSGTDSGVPDRPASPWQRYRDGDVVDLVAAYPLAWLSAGIGAPASLLPLLPLIDGEGRLTGLLGHMARHNPLAAALAGDGRAQILFTGPNGYVSPELAGVPDWAPTWNYAKLRIDATVRFDEAGGPAALEALTAAMEAGRAQPWTIAAMGPRYDRLRQGIVAFTASVDRVEGRFKLGQDERIEVLRRIVAGHPDPALVAWMRRFNADRL